MEINLTSESNINLLGMSTMVAALPQRVSTLLADTQLVSDRASQLFKTIGKNKVYGGALAGVGFGLSVYNAALAYERISSGDGQDHFSDWLILGSASFGALATVATLTPASVPLAGALGLISLAFDLAGSIAMLAPEQNKPVGAALLQLGLTLFFGFDAHHYQVMGKAIKGQKIKMSEFFKPSMAKKLVGSDGPKATEPTALETKVLETKAVKAPSEPMRLVRADSGDDLVPNLRREFKVGTQVVVFHKGEFHNVVVRGIAHDPQNPGRGLVMTDLPDAGFQPLSKQHSELLVDDMPERFKSWTIEELRAFKDMSARHSILKTKGIITNSEEALPPSSDLSPPMDSKYDFALGYEDTPRPIPEAVPRNFQRIRTSYNFY